MEAHISRSYMIGVRVYVGYEVRQNIADVLRRHHAESERHRVGRLAAAIIFIGFRVEELRIEGAAYSVSLSLIEGCIPTIAEHRCHPRYRNQVFIIVALAVSSLLVSCASPGGLGPMSYQSPS